MKMKTSSVPNRTFNNSAAGSMNRAVWAVQPLAVLVALALSCLPVFAQGPAESKFTIKSSVLGEERTILVRAPAGSDTNNRSYPVLYMTDGDAHMGHTASTVEFLARNGRISKLIVVGIPNTDRTRDLTPTKATDMPTTGGADTFLKFIETELFPEIEKRYRVQPYRILAGHSFGGLFTIHAMIARPELFHSYIAVSPSLQWSEQATLKRAEEFLKSRQEFNATLFTSLGNESGGILKAFVQLKEVLAKNPIPGFHWEAERWTDEDHGSVVLRSHYFGLRKIYEAWRVPRDPETGAVVGGLKGAEEHHQKLTKQFGYPIPVPESLVNDMGYQYMRARNTNETIATFQRNVDLYPASANVYDSLAEAYERLGRLDLATPLYEKAQTLGQQNNDPEAAAFKRHFARASEKLRQLEAAAKPKP